MSYSLVVIDNFKKEFKKLFKKYPSLKSDLIALQNILKDDPTQGVKLSRNCYKVRLAIKSKGKGKSGGARVITLVTIVDETVHLLSIYDKSEQDTISEKRLKELLDMID